MNESAKHTNNKKSSVLCRLYRVVVSQHLLASRVRLLTSLLLQHNIAATHIPFEHVFGASTCEGAPTTDGVGCVEPLTTQQLHSSRHER